jgi:hypothetical protein
VRWEHLFHEPCALVDVVGGAKGFGLSLAERPELHWLAEYLLTLAQRGGGVVPATFAAEPAAATLAHGRAAAPRALWLSAITGELCTVHPYGLFVREVLADGADGRAGETRVAGQHDAD